MSHGSISNSVIADIIMGHVECLENTRDFPSEEIPLGFGLRSPLLRQRNHARSALLTVFSTPYMTNLHLYIPI